MVEIVYHRGIDTKRVMTVLGNQHVKLNIKDIHTRFGVNDVIRIPDQDYPENMSPGDNVVHFNLPINYDRSGLVTVLPKIIKPGHFRPPDDEILPTLSLNDVWKAKVTKFIPIVGYEDLKPGWFKNPIGMATDPESLKDLILNRYQRSLPCSDCQEIISQGLSVTFLKLIAKVSWE
jgi:hypothetical protein